MDDIKFESINELYNRVLPALKSKKKELKKNNIKYISEKDIWLVISKFKWQKQKDLTLADIVDDILNTDNSKLLSMYHLYYRKDEDALELPKLKNNE